MILGISRICFYSITYMTLFVLLLIKPVGFYRFTVGKPLPVGSGFSIENGFCKPWRGRASAAAHACSDLCAREHRKPPALQAGIPGIFSRNYMNSNGQTYIDTGSVYFDHAGHESRDRTWTGHIRIA